MMKLTLAVLVGFVLGAGVSAVGSHAQYCCSMLDTNSNLQNELDHAALVQQEMAETIRFPKWSPPSSPCDR